MKSKNLVSLSVALVFLFLSVTGLLIYFGQGSHAVEHIHAWFGILFVTAALFHIVNNWSSIVGYSKDRRTGGIRREFVLPALVAVVFAGGIAADLPVFGKLANAGKNLVRGARPRPGGSLSQTTVDSIARATEMAYANATSKGDTAAIGSVVDKKTTILAEDGTFRSVGDRLTVPGESMQPTIDRAEAIGDNVIVVQGTSSNTTKTSTFIYTHVLKRNGEKWQITAVQTARPATKLVETTAAN
ncbi:MAG: hypothetical protein JWP57_3013 [Spirosoma sp.]|nr:hypothetical protein [Spirosoma sp.]